MTGFFKERNATELPYVEVYVGPNFVKALVTHPSSMEGGALRVPLVLSLARPRRAPVCARRVRLSPLVSPTRPASDARCGAEATTRGAVAVHLG